MDKTKKTDKVVVICYNRTETWNKRENALAFYRKGARCCEGCEKERYANIVLDLLDGEKVATDGFSTAECNTPLLTNAPDGSRDYNDRTDWKIVSL